MPIFTICRKICYTPWHLLDSIFLSYNRYAGLQVHPPASLVKHFDPSGQVAAINHNPPRLQTRTFDGAFMELNFVSKRLQVQKGLFDVRIAYFWHAYVPGVHVRLL